MQDRRLPGGKQQEDSKHCILCKSAKNHIHTTTSVTLVFQFSIKLSPVTDHRTVGESHSVLSDISFSTVNDQSVHRLLFPQLRNGPDGSAPALGDRLCGSSVPSVLQTTDNHLFIHFASDATIEGSGFKLTFEAHSQGTATLFLSIVSVCQHQHGWCSYSI